MKTNERKILYRPFLSTRKNKKYAVYVRGPNGTKKLIHFGDSRYQHYRDRIGFYSHLDHGDKERRKRYYQRHGPLPKSRDNAKWWSHTILW